MYAIVVYDIADKRVSNIIYTFRTTQYSAREIIGIRKGGEKLIL